MSTHQTIFYFECSDLCTFLEGLDITYIELCTFFLDIEWEEKCLQIKQWWTFECKECIYYLKV